MKTNEILAQNVNTLNANLVNVFFAQFVKHYNLNKEQAAKAKENLKELAKMEITLNLALITAITVGQW